MTDSPATPLADPGPPPPPPAGRPGPWPRFFSWVSGLGISRGDGWIGGVCAGIAARIGIDPVIVRGIVVVAALFGLPMFIAYAVAWALLPDLTGRIHLRELLERRFDPAMVGIGLMLLVGLFPVVPWFIGAVLPFGYLLPFPWFDWSGWEVFTTLVALALIGGVIFLIVRSSRRTTDAGVSSATDPRTASAASPTPGSPAAHQDYSGVLAPAPADPAPGDAAASFGAAGSALTLPTADLPPVPPVPPADPSNEADMAAWRQQQDVWRRHDHAWRRQQQDAERAAREQARRERAAAGAAFAAEAAERRRLHKASSPRTSFGFVVFVIGAGLVAGAATSLWQASVAGIDTGFAVATGLFAAALVTGLAMVAAGALRRRSGFLAFLAVALLVAGTITAAVQTTRGIVFGYAYVNNVDRTDRITQMWGPLTIDLADTGESEPLVIDKRGGDTEIWVGEGVLVDLSVTGADRVDWVRLEANNGKVLDEGTWRSTTGADGQSFVRERIDNRDGDSAERGTTQVVTLDQQSGTVHVTINEF